ncbi:hypothetical protein QCA50_014069 [Cerrena zonata]|uniref:Uncharacterized protein n=1 Tax=Cerrena zonata TaxID=2478898 RepID=A0AAW0FPM7_9APHY
MVELDIVWPSTVARCTVIAVADSERFMRNIATQPITEPANDPLMASAARRFDSKTVRYSA